MKYVKTADLAAALGVKPRELYYMTEKGWLRPTPIADRRGRRLGNTQVAWDEHEVRVAKYLVQLRDTGVFLAGGAAIVARNLAKQPSSGTISIEIGQDVYLQIGADPARLMADLVDLGAAVKAAQAEIAALRATGPIVGDASGLSHN